MADTTKEKKYILKKYATPYLLSLMYFTIIKKYMWEAEETVTKY